MMTITCRLQSLLTAVGTPAHRLARLSLRDNFPSAPYRSRTHDPLADLRVSDPSSPGGAAPVRLRPGAVTTLLQRHRKN